MIIMNEDISFKNIEDLYVRILPALRSEVAQLRKLGYTYLREDDIWNYLRFAKWIDSKELDLGIMVNDIFNIDVNKLQEFLINNKHEN